MLYVVVRKRFLLRSKKSANDNYDMKNANLSYVIQMTVAGDHFKCSFFGSEVYVKKKPYRINVLIVINFLPKSSESPS